MGRFFEGFRGNPSFSNLLWQESDSLFPFTCGKCRRDFLNGGKRWVASSLNKKSHYAAACECDDCHNGIDVNRKKSPKMAERRTELD
jgi:hypothetical protein